MMRPVLDGVKWLLRPVEMPRWWVLLAGSVLIADSIRNVVGWLP